ncbi:uncharacterized protein BDZ99DRAFT_170585 [Mytilinidion resinicola]|uniref:Uncharacterized protein n=1 Tax=Mytilinidion resinicola TaxID=574789 RepID=A0A6A6Y458_9PEZI|nr:uncharacterized protein BDZ99DRAFT_170585 [Mytilinidion resinicola]KAF2803303.1 hypothetical protein BDZ99DRAFT_170585 [Mytilinidion resinicola]
MIGFFELERISTHCGNIYTTPDEGDARKSAVWRTPVTNLEFNEHGAYARAGELTQRGYDLFRGGATEKTENSDLASKYQRMLEMQCSSRFFVTEKGYLGLGPPDAAPGQEVVILLGFHMPFVMSKNEDGSYELVGEAYVHGIMDGEAVPGAEVEELRIV